MATEVLCSHFDALRAIGAVPASVRKRVAQARSAFSVGLSTTTLSLTVWLPFLCPCHRRLFTACP